jgi:hypothetical protein
VKNDGLNLWKIIPFNKNNQWAAAIIFSIIVIVSCGYKHDNEKIILEFIQEDYDRDDLLYIAGIGSQGEINVTWKISREELEKQEELTLRELVNTIDIVKIIKHSDYFMQNMDKNYYAGRMYFHSIKYYTINNKDTRLQGRSATPAP